MTVAGHQDAPLIVTAAFDADAEATFQGLRDAHFPPRLNIVPAHLTLFHHLPAGALVEVSATLRAASRTAAIPFATEGLRFLGRGVAVSIAAPRLVAIRQQLAAAWKAWLTAQDRQPFRPHVTLQNKVDPATARALHDRLLAEGLAVRGSVVGLSLWRYCGGPWQPAGDFPFAEPAPASD